MKQHARAEAPWVTSARDLTHVPPTVSCLPSQPKQGHEMEQGTAVPAVLSPSQPCRLRLPCHQAPGIAQNPRTGASSVPLPSHQLPTAVSGSQESQELRVH